MVGLPLGRVLPLLLLSPTATAAAVPLPEDVRTPALLIGEVNDVHQLINQK